MVGYSKEIWLFHGGWLFHRVNEFVKFVRKHILTRWSFQKIHDGFRVAEVSAVSLLDKLWSLLSMKSRSGRPEVFCEKSVLRIFTQSTGKHLCQSLFFNKVAGLNFIKKETLAQVFSCEFCEISKNTFFIEHLWWSESQSLTIKLVFHQSAKIL